LIKLNDYKNEIYNKIDKLILDYELIRTMKLNEKAQRGGFFGGYPIIFEDETKIDQIRKIFLKYKIEIYPYHWMLHHKMNLFNKEEIKLPITEEIINKFFLIKIPFFLNFNFKNFKDCLDDCKRNKLV